jgi:YD repeat-containing protein
MSAYYGHPEHKECWEIDDEILALQKENAALKAELGRMRSWKVDYDDYERLKAEHDAAWRPRR